MGRGRGDTPRGNAAVIQHAGIWFDREGALYEPVETGQVLIPPKWEPRRLPPIGERYAEALERSRLECRIAWQLKMYDPRYFTAQGTPG
jgi:hypothetical protein